MKTLVLLLMSVLLFASCTKEDVIYTEPAVVKDPTSRTLPVTVDRNLILQLVNNVRQQGCQCGDTYYYPVPALKWNTQLEIAAYNHSADMFEKKYFAHEAPDGTKAGTRIDDAGYNWKAYGENIAKGYSKEKEALDGWLKSPGHCKNIMNKTFTEMGVARVGSYWTQALATR